MKESKEQKKARQQAVRQIRKIRKLALALAKRAKRATEMPYDGFGPKDEKNLRRVIRQAWSWSTPHRLVLKRCTREDGFQYCENPKCEQKDKPVPKVYVDHIRAAGRVRDVGYLERMFVPSTDLQGWCKKCHDPKTLKERGL